MRPQRPSVLLSRRSQVKRRWPMFAGGIDLFPDSQALLRSHVFAHSQRPNNVRPPLRNRTIDRSPAGAADVRDRVCICSLQNHKITMYAELQACSAKWIELVPSYGFQYSGENDRQRSHAVRSRSRCSHAATSFASQRLKLPNSWMHGAGSGLTLRFMRRKIVRLEQRNLAHRSFAERYTKPESDARSAPCAGSDFD